MLGLLKLGRAGDIKVMSLSRQSHLFRRFGSYEPKESDCIMKAVSIMGLEPSVAGECSVSQQLLNDLGNGIGDRIKHHHIDINEDKPNEAFQALWVVKYDGPGHLKAHTLQV